MDGRKLLGGKQFNHVIRGGQLFGILSQLSSYFSKGCHAFAEGFHLRARICNLFYQIYKLSEMRCHLKMSVNKNK